MTIQEKAKKYYDQFETTEKRGFTAESPKETIVIFKNTRDQKLYDSVMQAHGDRFPNDWVFSTYQRILGSIADYDIKTIDNLEEHRPEIVDSLVDVYTSNLTAWLNESIYNVSYIDDALDQAEDIGTDGIRLLSIAQYMAIDEIFTEVYSLLTS